MGFEVKCFYQDKPESIYWFAIYDDFSGGNLFVENDTGMFGTYDMNAPIPDMNWFTDSGYLWFIEINEKYFEVKV